MFDSNSWDKIWKGFILTIVVATLLGAAVLTGIICLVIWLANNFEIISQ